jgi:GNAT superfamily N-acetyltransferase
MTSSTFRIVPATAKDAPLVLQLVRELAEYERSPGEVAATEEGIREALTGEHPAAEALIAYAGEEVAGFALFFLNFSTWSGRRGLYLEDLFVKADYRGRGLGRILLGRLARIARERRCARMEWAVLDWNKDAIGFYEKLGAQAQNAWTVFRLSGEALERLASEKLDGESGDSSRRPPLR